GLGGLGFFFRLTDDWRNRLKLFAVAEIHQFYAHRVSAGFANFFDSRAYHLAFVGDEHDFVSATDRKCTNHVTGFLTGFHSNDAFAAARLPPVIIEPRPFATSIFAGDQQHGVWIDNGDRHDVIAFPRANSPNADCIAALIAQLFFVKSQAHSILGDEHDLVIAIR